MSVLDVENWARENGGISEVRHLMVGSHLADLTSRDYASEWTRQQDKAFDDEHRKQQMELTLRSVRAAENSAKFAFWAAVGAVGAAVVSAVTVALPYIPPR